MDVFGKIEVKSLENDFYLSNVEDSYDIFDRSADYQHVATVSVTNNDTVNTDINNMYFSRVLEPMNEPEMHNYLERLEMEANKEIDLEYSSDIGLVESVEEAGL